MESVLLLKDILNKNMWLCKIDLKDAYFSIPVHQADRKYLQFEWKGGVYQYTCLPFGLAVSPYVFTKVTKPIIAFLRRKGYKLIVYLDDVLVVAETAEEATLICEEAQQNFMQAGFKINLEKSVIKPTQKLEFLGFLVDTRELTFALPVEKIRRIQSLANDFLQKQSVTPREVACFVGLITAAKTALRSSTLRIRQLQLDMIKALHLVRNWDKTFVLSRESIKDLHWWSEQKEFPPSPINVEEVTLEIASDASLEGWGSSALGTSTGGKWSPEDKLSYPHINQLELLAAFLSLKCFWTPEYTSIRLLLDNKSAVAYINKLGGTKSIQLNKLALQMWEWCVERNVWVTAEHIPGVDNCLADWESRFHTDYSSWKLNKKVFHLIAERFRPKVDLFADRNTFQLPTYWSWKPDPDAEGVDAFTVKWKNLAAYAFPPFCLIARCVQKVLQEEADLLLVAPVWTSQFWYPMLLTSLWSPPILLPAIPDLLLDHKNEKHPLVVKGRLTLALWPVTGDKKKLQNFRKRLLPSCTTASAQSHGKVTTVPGENLIAGVVSGKRILFQSFQWI